MPNWLIVVYCLHVGAGLLWIGSSFLVAMAKGKGAEAQYRWQMAAAVVTMGVGLFLWARLHSAGFGRMEAMLALGALLGVAAAGAQGMLVGASLRKLKAGALSEEAARPRVVKGERLGAALTALALLCMVGSYHVGG